MAKRKAKKKLLKKKSKKVVEKKFVKKMIKKVDEPVTKSQGVQKSLKFIPLDLTSKDMPLEERFQKIVDVGKQRGFLTYDEINKNIPSDLTNATKLDEMLGLFEC